jgi:hypothetical protein
MLRAWIAFSQLLESRGLLFRHQPIFHVCGNAKLIHLAAQRKEWIASSLRSSQ